MEEVLRFSPLWPPSPLQYLFASAEAKPGGGGNRQDRRRIGPRRRIRRRPRQRRGRRPRDSPRLLRRLDRQITVGVGGYGSGAAGIFGVGPRQQRQRRRLLLRAQQACCVPGVGRGRQAAAWSASDSKLERGKPILNGPAFPPPQQHETKTFSNRKASHERTHSPSGALLALAVFANTRRTRA